VRMNAKRDVTALLVDPVCTFSLCKGKREFTYSGAFQIGNKLELDELGASVFDRG
jgi:hypothetical protein